VARLNKIMLWAATTVVIAFALFPNYLGYFLGGGDRPAAAAVDGEQASREFQIEGMTCEACAVTLRQHLSSVPGVARAEVSFHARAARVFFHARAGAPSEQAILNAIHQAGYLGRHVTGSRNIRIAVDGMTCEGCAQALQSRLARVAGVEAAAVNYDAASATVTLNPQGSLETVLTAIAEQGFKAREVVGDGLRK
jgi:Cu+-exporting ATPase